MTPSDVRTLQDVRRWVAQESFFAEWAERLTDPAVVASVNFDGDRGFVSLSATTGGGVVLINASEGGEDYQMRDSFTEALESEGFRHLCEWLSPVDAMRFRQLAA